LDIFLAKNTHILNGLHTDALSIEVASFMLHTIERVAFVQFC